MSFPISTSKGTALLTLNRLFSLSFVHEHTCDAHHPSLSGLSSTSAPFTDPLRTYIQLYPLYYLSLSWKRTVRRLLD